MMQTDTMSQLTSPQAVALQVVQWAISALIQWAGRQLPEGYNCHENVAVQRAKELFNWNEAKIGSLRLLFDRVTLSQKQRDRENYVPIQAIENCNPRIPYPLDAIPNTDLTDFKAKILKLPIQQNWENLSFLSLVLEKYGACLGFGKLDEKDACDVALTDLTRITAAVASAIASHPDAAQLRLVAGDLSGIQDFIYTISSDGALKSLRARSFYLELVTEEIVQQLLSELDLPRTSVIYAGGGNLYLLVPDGEEVKETVKRKGKEINRWLKREFQGKVFLAIDTQTCDVETVATPDFVKTWETAIEKVNRQKTLKFADQLDDILKPKQSHTPCKVCHRDDQRKLQRLNQRDLNSVISCSTCARMFRLGGQIMRVEKIVRSRDRWLSGKRLRFNLPSGSVYYNFYNHLDPVPTLQNQETLFLINNWDYNAYQNPNVMPTMKP